MSDHVHRFLLPWRPVLGSYWAKRYPRSHTEWLHVDEPRDTEAPRTEAKQHPAHWYPNFFGGMVSG